MTGVLSYNSIAGKRSPPTASYSFVRLNELEHRRVNEIDQVSKLHQVDSNPYTLFNSAAL